MSEAVRKQVDYMVVCVNDFDKLVMKGEWYFRHIHRTG